MVTRKYVSSHMDILSQLKNHNKFKVNDVKYLFLNNKYKTRGALVSLQKRGILIKNIDTDKKVIYTLTSLCKQYILEYSE